MPDSPLGSLDHAWSDRRRLGAVLLPVVAAIVLVPALLDLILGDGRLVIVDGVVRPLEAGLLAGAKLAVTVLLWPVGLIAGVWTLARPDVGPAEALGHGVKHLPAFVVGLIAAAGGLFLALWAVARLGPVVIVAVLIAAALLAARVLLDGVGWAVSGGSGPPTWAGAVAFLVGGVGVPLLLATALRPLAFLGAPVDAVLVTVALAVQVALAARVRAEATARRRVWPGVAMVAVAVLVSSAVVAANPYDAPVVDTNAHGPATAVKVAWPAGRHPVIATSAGAWFCDDDLCETFANPNGGPPTGDGHGSADIGADGTVLRTAVTGGPDTGGPFVHYARCVREGCREAWLPVRTGATGKLDPDARVEAAGAVAPDGALWFFVAVPIRGTYRFQLIRCPDAACAAPKRHQVGAVPRTPRDRFPDGRRARLTVGADGRPAAAFWMGWSVHRYGCEPVTCAAPRETIGEATTSGPFWDLPVRPDSLTDGAGSVLLTDGAAVAVTGSSVYVTGPLPGTPGSGFRVTIGEPARHWRQTVWRCRATACDHAPLDAFDGEPGRSLIAVAGDGRVLVVREGHVSLLRSGL